MSVKSVYNFVPAPKESEVFKPDWAEKVSHDVPFSDGESGEIEIEIEAKTPIFIRNGHSKQDAEEKNERYLEFSNVVRNGKKEYFIPGSSLKGMFRNVLEIMSLSRMKMVDNFRPSVRQIMRTRGTVVDEGYTLKDHKKDIRAGWLIEQNGDYYIYDCGAPMKIRYTDLDKKFNNGFSRAFGKNGAANIKSNFSNRTATYKYKKIIGNKPLEYLFEKHPLDETEKQKSWKSSFQPLNYARFAENETEETFYGTIVCSGQSMEYNNTQARKGEYVFKGKRKDIIQDEKRKIKLDEIKFKDFLLVNRHKQPDELEDWKYFKNKITEGIPVFFRTKKKESNEKEILDFGLTFMYKEPAKYSISDLSPIKTYPKPGENYDYDLADLIFGVIRKNKELKGRVMISHAFATNAIEESEVKNVILSSPRPSYFPFYIKQTGNNGLVKRYNTYNTSSTISGFKRYPVKSIIDIKNSNDNQNLVTSFKPLKSGIIFKGKIRFHNLKKVEIGALISAITFHNTNQAYHSLGYAKPFGYGKVKVEMNSLSKNLKYEAEEYLRAFEIEMKKHFLQWDTKVRSLLSMAFAPHNINHLVYPELSEFQQYKNSGKYLMEYINNINFSGLVSIVEINKIIEEEKRKIDEAAKKREEEEAKRKKQKEEENEQKYKNYIAKADSFMEHNEWKEAIEFYEKAINIKDNEYPHKQIKKCRDFIEGQSLSLEQISKFNDFNKGKRIIEEYYKKATGSTLINDEIQVSILKEFIRRCIQKSNKRWKKPGKQDWKLVEKWVGNETARKWFEEMI